MWIVNAFGTSSQIDKLVDKETKIDFIRGEGRCPVVPLVFKTG
jgi:hypothetical protein